MSAAIPTQLKPAHRAEDGARKARQPVILTIDAAAAASAGIAFYAGNDKVWLADRIGPEFISAER